MIAKWASVVVNTTDVDRLVAFWTKVLGVDVLMRPVPEFVWLEPQQPGGIKLAFQEVCEPTEGRRRLHLDFGVPNLEEATTQIIELGGAHAEDHAWEGFNWRVMTDPDGNEFCIGEVISP